MELPGESGTMADKSKTFGFLSLVRSFCIGMRAVLWKSEVTVGRLQTFCGSKFGADGLSWHITTAPGKSSCGTDLQEGQHWLPSLIPLPLD